MTVALDSIPVSSHIRVEGEARKMEADANTPTCMLIAWELSIISMLSREYILPSQASEDLRNEVRLFGFHVGLHFMNSPPWPVYSNKVLL